MDTKVSSSNAPAKELGVFSAIFLIFNTVVGTGIFATPSLIFALSGSVGAALLMWFAGFVIAGSGMLVYLEWGTAIPKNGGEKNYLGYFYSRPRHLVLSMYAFYVLLLGQCAGNSVLFGEYVLNAAGKEVDRWNQRGIALACISTCLIVHSVNVKLGLWIQNSLGLFKLGVVLTIVVSGWIGLAGGLKSPKTSNFENAFSGHTPTGYGIVMALYNVIWSYAGYSNANYALGEAKNPVRVLKIAAPLALVGVAVIYIFVNIAYFAIVPKEEILSSGRTLAADYFRRAFGESAQRTLSACVALSALGNVMAGMFSQGRLVQALGREGVLPFSRFFASSRPLQTPAAGLLAQWLASAVVILAPPPGDAYNFILNLSSYPFSIINTLVSLGLVLLTVRRERYGWRPPLRATLPVSVFFLVSSVYLVAAPYIPPSVGQSVYKDLPYWLHCVVGTGFFVVGAVYWVVRFKVLPRFWPEWFLEVPEPCDEEGEVVAVVLTPNESCNEEAAKEVAKEPVYRSVNGTF